MPKSKDDQFALPKSQTEVDKEKRWERTLNVGEPLGKELFKVKQESTETLQKILTSEKHKSFTDLAIEHEARNTLRKRGQTVPQSETEKIKAELLAEAEEFNRGWAL